jgi:hypothetical protein
VIEVFFHRILERPERDCINIPFRCPHRKKNPSGLDPTTEEAMQLAFNM